MKARLIPTVLSVVFLTAASLLAADPAPTAADKTPASENPKNPVAQPPPSTVSASDTSKPAPVATKDKKPGAKASSEPATVMPKVEVKKSRITELDRQLNEEDQAIAREKQNTEPTALDDTLNNPKLAKALSIFGGSSSEVRAGLAKERVSLMKEEKDLLEEIAQAKTKEEKEELQEVLDGVRQTRRELEHSPQ